MARQTYVYVYIRVHLACAADVRKTMRQLFGRPDYRRRYKRLRLPPRLYALSLAVVPWKQSLASLSLSLRRRFVPRLRQSLSLSVPSVFVRFFLYVFAPLRCVNFHVVCSRSTFFFFRRYWIAIYGTMFASCGEIQFALAVELKCFVSRTLAGNSR